MTVVSVGSASGGYQVVIEKGSLSSAGRLMREAGVSGSLRVVADEGVYRLYGAGLEASLGSEGYQLASFKMPSGEASKSLEHASRVYDWLIETSTERRDTVVALGGGVAGDLAGFVAATYLRGVGLVQLPTSLLAQVDSSVGGKVAVNHPRGKNLIGAFYPPSLVVVDPLVLGTLPPRELTAAMAEVVKMAAILDARLFARLEAAKGELRDPTSETMEQVIGRCVELKARVVEADEREGGLRAVLNFGHTIGHAIEAVAGYGLYRHGEAVAVGMMGAASIAQELGMLAPRDFARLAGLLDRMRLPLSCPGLSPNALAEAMEHDKKASQRRLAWVLPEGLGKARVRRDVDEELVRRALEALTRGGSSQS